MSDVAVIVPFVAIAFLGGLGIGVIIYVLAKNYIKSRMRNQK